MNCLKVMVDYKRYGDSRGITQQDMVRTIRTDFPYFGKSQMSMAANPSRNAVQLIPDAEKLLEKAFGKGPGLSITPKLGRNHGNKKKPNRLCVRIDDALRSRLQKVYEQMCFASMQDLLEAAIAGFVEKYEVKH